MRYKHPNRNHKLSKEEKSKLSKYKKSLRVPVNPNFVFRNKRKLLIQKSGFIIPNLLASFQELSDL